MYSKEQGGSIVPVGDGLLLDRLLLDGQKVLVVGDGDGGDGLGLGLSPSGLGLLGRSVLIVIVIRLGLDPLLSAAGGAGSLLAGGGLLAGGTGVAGRIGGAILTLQLLEVLTEKGVAR